MMQLYSGHDPGMSGAWGILDGMGKYVLSGHWKPDGLHGFERALDQYERDNGIILSIFAIDMACIEKVSGNMPRGGALMKTAGMWVGYFIGKKVPFEEVHMSVWMQQIRKTGKRPPEMRLEKARCRWPDAPWTGYKKDRDVADALWLAEYARKLRLLPDGA